MLTFIYIHFNSVHLSYNFTGTRNRKKTNSKAGMYAWEGLCCITLYWMYPN